MCVFTHVCPRRHLETVSDLASEALIASLKRFTALRGRTLELFSDRGTNFVGANREFKRMLFEVFLMKSVMPLLRKKIYSGTLIHHLHRTLEVGTK